MSFLTDQKYTNIRNFLIGYGIGAMIVDVYKFIYNLGARKG